MSATFGRMDVTISADGHDLIISAADRNAGPDGDFFQKDVNWIEDEEEGPIVEALRLLHLDVFGCEPDVSDRAGWPFG